MTAEEWDSHWYRIRGQLLDDGALPAEAAALADIQTRDEFGPRPEETT